MEPRPEPRFDWFIPIDGDGAHIGTWRAERPPTFDYLRQVVETAEAEGFYSLLIPTRFANGLFGETAPLAETWTTVTALAAVTRRIRFLVAIRPGSSRPACSPRWRRPSIRSAAGGSTSMWCPAGSRVTSSGSASRSTTTSVMSRAKSSSPPCARSGRRRSPWCSRGAPCG